MRRVMIGLCAVAVTAPAWAQSITSETLAPPPGVAAKLSAPLAPNASVPLVPKMPSMPSAAAAPAVPALPDTTTVALQQLQVQPSASAVSAPKMMTVPATIPAPTPSVPSVASGEPHGVAPSLLGHSAPGRAEVPQGEGPRAAVAASASLPVGSSRARPAAPKTAALPAPFQSAALSQPDPAHAPAKPAAHAASVTLGKSAAPAKTPIGHKATHSTKPKSPLKPGAATA